MRSEFTLIVSIPSRGSGLGKRLLGSDGNDYLDVSIPSRGSGLGKLVVLSLRPSMLPLSFNPLSGKWFRKVKLLLGKRNSSKLFQSPLGEVV